MLDFGMVRMSTSHSEFGGPRDEGAGVGTPGYMSPEQISDKADRTDQSDRIDRRADVFGLGGLLFFLLTGEPPCPHFPAPDVDAERLRSSGHDHGLIEICLQALSTEPKRRYQYAAEMAAALDAWLTSNGMTDGPASSLTARNGVAGPAPDQWRRQNKGRPRSNRNRRASETARVRYLQDFGGLLAAMDKGLLHNALRLDLGLAPVHDMLWSYSAPTDGGDLPASLDDAFDSCDRRLLLLGRPGAGKSTSLIQIGLRLVAEAELAVDAPLPLLVNLSEFEVFRETQRSGLTLFRTREPSDEAIFEEWLGRSWAKFPGTKRFVHDWLRNGDVAFLFDGLDEVSDTMRPLIVRLINEELIDQHPDRPVVVCSRLNEAQQLFTHNGNRLKLSGSLCLNPLTSAQIRAYLMDASAPDLLNVVLNDVQLLDLARTPLTLGMISVAYRNMPPDRIPRMASRSALYDQLMHDYLRRGQQRVERRRRGMVCDNNLEHDVPVADYRYTPDALGTSLEWLAIRLGRRMQISTSLASLDQLLEGTDGALHTQYDWYLRNACRFPFIAFVVGCVAVPGSLFAGTDILESIAASILVTAMLSIALVMIGNIRQLAVRSLLYVWAAGFIGIGAVSTASADAFQRSISPAAAETALWMYLFTGMLCLFISSREVSQTRAAVPLIGCLIVSAIYATLPDPLWPKYSSLLPRNMLGITLFWIAYVATRHNLQTAFFIGIMVLGGNGLSWMAGAVLAATGTATLPIFYFIYVQCAMAVPVLLLDLPLITIATATVALLCGGSYAILTCVAMTVLAMWAGTRAGNAKVAPKGFVGGRLYPIQELRGSISRWFHSPSLRLMLWLTARFPLRARRFIRYCDQGLFLQEFVVRGGRSNEFRFVHRLFRDYCALRTIRLALHGEDGAARLVAIRNLSGFGDAALGLLGEFVHWPDSNERLQAVKALGDIPGPESAGYLQLAICDAEPRIRKAALLCSDRLPEEHRRELVQKTENDRETSVQLARIAVLSGYQREKERELRDAEDAWYRRNMQLRTGLGTAALALSKTSMDRGLGELLIALRDDEDFRVRSSAAFVLGLIRDDDAVTSLVASLEDPSLVVGMEACLALATIRDRRAVDGLLVALRRRSRIQAFVAMALAAIGDTRAIPALRRERLLTDKYAMNEIDKAIQYLTERTGNV